MDQAQATFFANQMTALMEQEFKTTCRVLEAVPDDQHGYRPDEKSRTAWELTTHIPTSDLWFLDGIINGAFAPGGDGNGAESQFKTVADVVAFYKREYPARLATLRAMPAEKLAAQVDFFGMMQQPAAAFLGLANNHTIHHRGQLCAYLRAMGSKVPAIYGGSADEPMS